MVLLGAGALLASAIALPSTPRWGEWLAFSALGLLAGTAALRVPGVSAIISASDTFFMAAAMLFGPAPATLAMAVDSTTLALRRKHPPHRLLFNATAPALALWAAAHLFFRLTGTAPLREPGWQVDATIPALVAMAVVYYALNSGLTAGAIALESGQRLLPVWRRLWPLAVNYAAASSAAFCIVVVVRFGGFLSAAVVMPLVLVFHGTLRSFVGRLDDAQQHAQRMDRLYVSAIETLATAIDAKDGVTHDHVRRVQAYAVGLAKVLGVSDDSTLKAIQAAALLHDTGKLGIPEHILNKPGRLTPAEFEQMKTHVELGAQILSAIDFPFPVVPIVAAHHENWDGTGYPNGLRGTDIPIGARILSVVDCYDALTSDRPYRPALTRADAFEVLHARRGNMYDPLVVDTFVRVFDTLTPVLEQPLIDPQALHQITGAARLAATPAPSASGDGAGSVAGTMPSARIGDDAPDELRSLLGLARLAQGDLTIADAGVLASTCLRSVLPDAVVAFYLLEPVTSHLVVRYVSGSWAGQLLGTRIALGQRLSGWVAAHQRPIVNSDAALDLYDRDLPFKSALAVPMVHGPRVVGVVTAYSMERQPFSEAQHRLLTLIAPYLAETFVAATAREQDRATGRAARLAPRRATGIAAATDLRVVFRQPLSDTPDADLDEGA